MEGCVNVHVSPPRMRVPRHAKLAVVHQLRGSSGNPDTSFSCQAGTYTGKIAVAAMILPDRPRKLSEIVVAGDKYQSNPGDMCGGAILYYIIIRDKHGVIVIYH